MKTINVYHNNNPHALIAWQKPHGNGLTGITLTTPRMKMKKEKRLKKKAIASWIKR
jgi:hypothetical protein